jgi:hypothetical protein
MDPAGRDYPPGDLRVSDADRDRAISELSAAFQAGRLTSDEFDERSGQALRARTGEDLTALLADLPVERAPAAPPADPRPALRALGTRVTIAAAAAATAFAAIAIAAANAASHTPTAQQRELAQQLSRQAQEIMARQAATVPAHSAPGTFAWAGAITPAAVAVLIVLMIIFLRVSRAHRP